MQNLYTELKQLLQHDERFLTPDGKLLKNHIVEKALQLDAPLIKLLLTHTALKAHFFETIDELLVFDKIKFQRFVMNKQFLPDSYTQYKNKIGLVTAQDNDYLTESREVVLAWPYKDCVLEGGQTKDDDRRNETFWNETLAPDQIDRLLTPKVLTNFKQYTPQGEQQIPTQIDTNTSNLLIKGNNLLVLHSLLPAYQGKVKLIYIDPPYNTGKDSFNYNDSFNHSTWLTFMKNRLEIARKLLSEEGVIFVSLDDKEAHYCKILMDGIFGRENFIADICHKARGSVSNDKIISPNHNHILLFAKNERTIFTQKHLFGEKNELKGFDLIDKNGNYKLVPVDGPGGEKKANPYYEFLGVLGYWRFSRERMQRMYEEGLIIKKGNGLYQKYYEEKAQSSRKTVTTWWDSGFLTSSATTELKKLMNEEVFSNPKNINLLKSIIDLWVRNENDIVLDFFAGSGTTAQAVLDLNKEDGGDRKFIVCEQMDYIETVTKARICKVMENNQAGSFIYCELMPHNQHYIDQITAAQSTEQLASIWAAMQERAFLSYRVNAKSIHLSDAEFTSLSFTEQQSMLLSLLDKNMLYVPYSEIDDLDWNIDEADKALNKQFYGQQ